MMREYQQIRSRTTELMRLYPLAFSRLWDPYCRICALEMEHLPKLGTRVFRCGRCTVTEVRTSQRLSVVDLFKPSVTRGFLLGGNRTGKSEGCAQIAVAVALGRNSNQVQLWARNNRLDVSWIQPGPGQVWAVALDSGDSRRYVRPKVAKFLPHGSRWRNRDGAGEAEVVVPSTTGSGKITFKANDQGRDGFQGDAKHLVWFDEEPSLPVVTECDYRLVDYDHRYTDPDRGVTKMVFSMTPLQGWTALLRHNLRGDPHATRGDPLPGVVRVNLHGLDNPHISGLALQSRYDKTAAHQRDSREKGSITALEGRIYTDWDQSIHVIDPFDIPEEWERFGAIDFGFTHPFCHLWGAIDPDGRLVVYREHYKSRWILRKHAKAIIEAESCPNCWDGEGFGTESQSEEWWQTRSEGCDICDHTGRAGPEIDQRWADPENADGRRTLSVDYGLVNSPAKKRVSTGITRVAERLIVQPDGKPRLLVFSGCVNLIAEFTQYRWKPSRGQAETEPKPLKTNDHAMDTLRYLCMGVGP